MKRDFETDPLALHVFIMPKRGKHRATNIVRGLSLNGLFMLFFAPQIGIISLAASQVIQRMYREDISTADRRAVIASAAPASRELEREIKHRIEEQFATLTERLKDDASSAYRRGVEQITEMLDERAKHQQDLETRRAEIRAVVRERLPRLRALSQQMDRGVSL
jgi:soluble cytochrome b562